MKILYITYGLSTGGAERFLTDLLNQMVLKEDVEVTLLLLKAGDIPGSRFYEKELDTRIHIKSLGFHKIGLSVIPKLYKAIRNEQPDVVHVHLSPIILFCLFSMLFYRKAVYIETLHNEVARIDAGSYSRIKGLLKGFMYKTGLVKVVTISDKNTREYKRVFGRSSDALIYNGRKRLERTKLYPNVLEELKTLKADESTLVFIHIARCDKQKNQMLLVEAFNEFAKDKNVILLVLGRDFDKKEGFALQQAACEKIHFLGEKRNVQDYLLCSDAFVLSSLYEGMPITLIEAMECGCVPISTPVSGVVDLVRNGENGFISKDFSKESFISILNEFMLRKDQIDRDALVQLFNDKLSIEACSNSYYHFYKQCLLLKTTR